MSTAVFCRIDGKLVRFEVGTADHVEAIYEVVHKLVKDEIPPDSAVLALIEGGKA